MAATSQDLKIYRYPYKKLDKSEDYLKIECIAYRPPGFGESFGDKDFSLPSSDEAYATINKKHIRGTLILPIPDGLPQNGNSVSWGESTINPLQAGLIGIGQEAVSGGPIEGIKAAFNTGAKVLEAAKTGIGQKTIQSGFVAGAVGQLLGQQDLFRDVLGRETGSVFNENTELLFRGITLRSAFTFNFDIVPRFKAEAEQIRQMIVFLKQEMAAKKGNPGGAAAGLFLTAPSVFRIQYMSGANPHPYLNTFKICALNNLQLNFTGSNTYATYSDGTPVHMQLGLTFQELTPIYNEDYKQVTGTGY